MTAIELDGETVLLRPVARETAAELLAGPRAADAAPNFHSWFVVRRDDGAVVGELGYSFDPATATANVGYSIVEPSWGRGYATDGVRALCEHLRADPRVRRIVANTLVGHVASRRVMEKAGMSRRGERLGEEGGELVELVDYELDGA